MLNYTNMYAEAKRRLQELYCVKENLERNLCAYPPGRIHVANSRGRVQFYLRGFSKDMCEKYLSLRKDKELIQTYLQKQYDDKVLKQINREIGGLEKLLNGEMNFLDKLRSVYSNNPKIIKDLICPIEGSDEDFRTRWLAQPYEPKGISDDTPYYRTERGERVRSKSELNIANALYKYDIPYKYEQPLILKNGARIYPDFTVLVCKERRQMYWEHRGMMDDRDYLKYTVIRMKEYIVNDYVQGRDFLITEEMSSRPLGTNEIEKVIHTHFL